MSKYHFREWLKCLTKRQIETLRRKKQEYFHGKSVLFNIVQHQRFAKVAERVIAQHKNQANDRTAGILVHRSNLNRCSDFGGDYLRSF